MLTAGIESFALDWKSPPGFSEFWSSTMSELHGIPPEPSRRPPGMRRHGLEFQELAYRSLGGVEISAYLLSKNGDEARPLLVHTHGYNAQYDVMHAWAERGFHVFGFDARGFGRSVRACKTVADGYVLTGIESPESSILRGAVCDYHQAVSAAHGLLGERISRTILTGFSFGGALALMAGAFDRRADFIVVGQPTFAWTPERRRLSLAGSTAEINRYIAKHPRRQDCVLDTLKFFDTLDFATLIGAPTLIGIGLDDDVVPSRTVLALVNQLRCAHEVRLMPVSHSSDPRESLWSHFDDEWVSLALEGLPRDFGAEHRKIGVVG